MKQILKTTVNGRAVELLVDPSQNLLDCLREELQLTGCKKGCGEGECGACTIIMNGEAVNSCIIPVMKAMDAKIETVEGLGKKGDLHPLQEEFINQGAVQCGYCIPGMLMSSKALLDKTPDPTQEEIRYAMGGNICRCTGYVKIENAIISAAEKLREGK